MVHKTRFDYNYSPYFIHPKNDKEKGFIKSVAALKYCIQMVWGDTDPIFKFIERADTEKLGWSREELRNIVYAAFESMQYPHKKFSYKDPSLSANMPAERQGEE